MTYNVITLLRAESETDDAFKYYEDQKPGLGFEFLDELEEGRRKLSKNPQFYSFISSEKSVRSLALKRFPYKIVFEISGDKVIVLSIFNRHRKSFK